MNEDEEFEFRLRMEREAGAGTAVAEPPTASLADKMAGSWGGRILQGAASPVLAGVQMLGGEKGREMVAELDAMKKRGMAAEGKEGFDWYGLLGSMVPGAGIAKGVGAAIPAAGTLGKILQGGAIGAATAAAQPVAPSPDFWTDKAVQTGTGAALGAVIPSVGSAITSMRGTPQMNPTKAATLAEGQKAGYVIPPSTVNPSWLTNRLESIGGKAAVGQEAAKRNQEVTNALVAKSLGLPKDTTVTPELLSDFRSQQGKVYEDISKISGDAKNALNELKQARHDSKVQWNFYNKSGNPEALTAAKNADGLAEMATDELEREAREAGRSELVKELASARVKIAKSYDVSRALNAASGEINAPTLGRLFAKRGEKSMTGELATIGKMAGAFKPSMREGGSVPSSGVSGTDAAATALLATMGGGAAGAPGVLAGGLPLLRGPARNLVLSPGYQQFATQGLSPQRQAMIDALMQQGAGVAGTSTGRMMQ